MTTGIDLLRHALGVQQYQGPKELRYSKPYRNHFEAGEDDAAAWEALVASGFATWVYGPTVSDHHDTTLYCVTTAGRELALRGITFKRRWGHARPEGER